MRYCVICGGVFLAISTAIACTQGNLQVDFEVLDDGVVRCVGGKQHELQRGREHGSVSDVKGANTEWKVIKPGYVGVHRQSATGAEVIGVKSYGAILVGVEEDSWLQLRHSSATGQRGEDAGQVNTIFLQKRHVRYATVASGTCALKGLHPIFDASICEAAAAALGLGGSSAESTADGCESTGKRELWVPRRKDAGARSSPPHAERICSTASYPLPSRALRNPRETKTHPSLFCFMVTSSTGPEFVLVKHQLKEGLGIFGCEMWEVFTPTPSRLVDHSYSTPVGDFLALDGWSDSWRAGQVFLTAWHSVHLSGRYEHCDWVLRAHPDTVFLPGRLRERLSGMPEGDAVYFKTLHYDASDLGFDVLSTKAVRLYFEANKPQDSGTNKSLCEQNGMLGIMGKGDAFSACMEQLDVAAGEEELVSQGWNQTECRDQALVAFRSFRYVEDWRACLQRAEKKGL